MRVQVRTRMTSSKHIVVLYSNSKRASVRECYNRCVLERASRMKRGMSFQRMLNECNAHMRFIPFLFVITLQISISSVALRDDTSAARFE